MDQLDDILEHYGVKGMKWGVRRDQKTLDRLSGRRSEKRAAKKAAKAPSEDAKKAAEIRSKVKKGGVQTLSNDQLKALNERLNLEQQYSRMTTPKKTKNAKVSEFEKQLIKLGLDFAWNTAMSQVKKNKAGKQVGKALGGPDIIDLRNDPRYNK